MSERIVAAAIQRRGYVALVEQPGRHHNVLHALARDGASLPVDGEQGFVTDAGRFVGRNEAMKIALAAKQIIPREGQHGADGHLFSEDLW